MKIIHTASGKPYHLKPGTQLEVERTNLFFNEWGEQSSPMELPDTDHNRSLLGYPDLLGNQKKPSTQIPVTIEDDGYFMACRQAILGAQRKNSISTSFYMNEGSFLARISKTQLSEVFGDETIPGITTVEQGINFCRSLTTGMNPHFAIFPVLIQSDENYENGYPIYKFINRYGFTNNGRFDDRLIGTSPRDFYSAIARTETVNDETINLSPGYYMSPFIRINYLLTRIFRYFGYTLLDNFFTRTHPFPDMVLINNCADALVNGSIRLVDLLPDCMCSTILNLFRKKFCCEFIPDEASRTVDIKLFNEVVDMTPTQDFTPHLVSEPSIGYPEYEQLIISSDETLSDDASVEPSDSLGILFSKYPAGYYDLMDGTFTRQGYHYAGIFLWTPFIKTIQEIVAPSSMRYYAGGNLKTKEIKVPDMQPEFRNIYDKNSIAIFNTPLEEFLLAGSANFLNSKLVLNKSSESSSTSEDTQSGNSSLKPMLAFFYTENNCPRGTISSVVKTIENIVLPVDSSRRLSDYSLCYNGPDGIFERFYRKYDDLCRNSLHKVKAKFLLSDTIKQFCPSHQPVTLLNQKLFINSFKYQIGGKNEPSESELLTTKLYDPVSSAPPTDSVDTGYVWATKYSAANVTKEQYNSSPYKDRTFEIFYPVRPTSDLAGKRNYEQTTCLPYRDVMNNTLYGLVTFWLECIKKST